ncbi:MAG: hypothetical protein AB8C02_16465 [Halioglobus sp.]
MNKLLASLALCALASHAQAGSDNQSFMQCGVKLGGTEVVYTGQPASKREERKQVTYRTGLIGSDASGISEVARAKARQVEKRLPMTVTVAQFGCSW